MDDQSKVSCCGRSLFKRESELFCGEGNDCFGWSLYAYKCWRSLKDLSAAVNNPVVEPHEEVCTTDFAA